MQARITRPPIDRRSPRTLTSLTAAARNVVSTGRTDGPAEKSCAMWVCESEARLMASCALSERATRTISGAITRTSSGSVWLGFGVACIGAPYSVPCHPHQGGRWIDAGSTTFRPTLHSGLTKARRYDGEYEAANRDSLSGTRPGRAPTAGRAGWQTCDGHNTADRLSAGGRPDRAMISGRRQPPDELPRPSVVSLHCGGETCLAAAPLAFQRPTSKQLGRTY